MFVSEFLSEFLPTEEEVFDFLFPELPVPVPWPGRIASKMIQLQFEAGLLIEAGVVEGLDQYTGQTSAKDNAVYLGHNLIYQPGGMKI